MRLNQTNICFFHLLTSSSAVRSAINGRGVGWTRATSGHSVEDEKPAHPLESVVGLENIATISSVAWGIMFNEVIVCRELDFCDLHWLPRRIERQWRNWFRRDCSTAAGLECKQEPISGTAFAVEQWGVAVSFFSDLELPDCTTLRVGMLGWLLRWVTWEEAVWALAPAGNDWFLAERLTTCGFCGFIS